MLSIKKLDYHDGPSLLEGFCAYEEDISNKPVVLVFHDWSGKNDFSCHKAEQLAALGYVGFAVDMFGKGKLGTTKEEKNALIQPFLENRELLQKRILAGLNFVKTIPRIDSQRIGAIGFCFGGLCALDLARSGVDVQAVVSFHGLLNAPENLSRHPIKAKILALHGFSDPMVTPDQVMAFGEEMTEANADWQLDMYGNVMHAFTNPQAHDPSFGTVYNKQADLRSWIAMKNFFAEVFGI